MYNWPFVNSNLTSSVSCVILEITLVFADGIRKLRMGGFGCEVNARVMPAGNDMCNSPVVFVSDLEDNWNMR